jgi:hypothetical protein
VYVNVEYDWYIPTKDNIRRRICAMYAQLLSENVEFRDNVTGLLTQNDNDEFILKLYDFENDEQFSFSTIELMYLGADRKTRIPVPLETLNVVADRNIEHIPTIPSILPVETKTETAISYTTDWDILGDGTSGTDVFDPDEDVVLSGVNDPPMLFTLVDGNDPTL